MDEILYRNIKIAIRIIDETIMARKKEHAPGNIFRRVTRKIDVK